MRWLPIGQSQYRPSQPPIGRQKSDGQGSLIGRHIIYNTESRQLASMSATNTPSRKNKKEKSSLTPTLEDVAPAKDAEQGSSLIKKIIEDVTTDKE